MYLFGASGHCKVIIDIIQKSNLEVIEYIIDDNPTKEEINTIPILETPNNQFLNGKSLIISIGNNEIRKKIANRFSANYLVAIHPNSILCFNVTIDEGTVIMAGAILNSDVSIGKHCIINTGACIDHDCNIEDYVHIAPNASIAGNVTIKEGSFIGIGSAIINNITIEQWCIIGAGSVLINDLKSNVTVVGNPAKFIKNNLL